ncbi:GAP family protein [Catellatospora sp. NPDC049609]|uniref:GAP family protein n=1 Tax=Catellatospora sp. NPDC049609 TaxID=3155505 RepID=UPI00343E29D0
MGEVIGELLPLALGVAISPIPVIAVILMLLAPRAGAAAAGFLLGWVIGIMLAVIVFIALAGRTAIGTGGEPTTAASVIKLLLGVLLLVLAVLQWRSRPQPGEQARLPGWLAAIDKVTPGKAIGLGFVLSALNVKNLPLLAAAGLIVGTAGLSGGGAALAVLIFAVIAVSTVAIPVIGHEIAHDRISPWLDRLKAWLVEHHAAVMTVLLTVIGAVLLGKGLGGLWH